MRRRDDYRGFATHYDLHGWDWFAASHGERLMDLLAERDIAAGRVLDAGCGTGTLALAFARRGHRVTAVDLSGAMIRSARAKDTDGAVTWKQADIVNLDLPGEHGGFDLITCVADTLNHLPTPDDWEAAFRRFAVHLRPNGHLFFDVATARGLQRMDNQTAGEHDGRTLILACIYEPSTRRSTLKVTSFIPADRPDLYEKATETVTVWGQPVADVLVRLTDAGFRDPERPWAGSDDPESEDRLMVLACKP